MKLGPLIELRKDPKHPKRFIYRCFCGKEFPTYRGSVKSKKTRSCGCYRHYLNREQAKALKIHGHTWKNNGRPTKTYVTWMNMKQRCINSKHPEYHNYGARDIKVCESWLKSFENFLEDMGEQPKGLSIDRIDNTKGYSKQNCRWTTQKHQCSNTRRNVWCTLPDGTHGTITQLCEIYNIRSNTVATRVARGMDLVTAITKPTRKHCRKAKS